MPDHLFKRVPHNPPHWFVPNAFYMLTACIYQRTPLMQSPARKAHWRDAFCKSAGLYQWVVIAWVVLYDHYHAIVRSPADPTSLSKFVASYHKFTARTWNDEDKARGRQVWWNYWDTCLLTEHDFHTRLRYMFWNPVEHGLVRVPEEYAFSSYLQFTADWQAEFDFAGAQEVRDDPEP